MVPLLLTYNIAMVPIYRKMVSEGDNEETYTCEEEMFDDLPNKYVTVIIGPDKNGIMHARLDKETNDNDYLILLFMKC